MSKIKSQITIRRSIKVNEVYSQGKSYASI